MSAIIMIPGKPWHPANLRGQNAVYRSGTNADILRSSAHYILGIAILPNDIKWATDKKEGIRNFFAEEFFSEEVIVAIDGKEYLLSRYIHAVFDPKTKYFWHFDGAIHFYTLDEYFARRDSNFNHDAKSSSQIKSASKKLFMLNGKVNVEIWKQFSSHFFSGDPLIIEYFEGSLPEKVVVIIAAIRCSRDSGAVGGI